MLLSGSNLKKTLFQNATDSKQCNPRGGAVFALSSKSYEPSAMDSTRVKRRPDPFIELGSDEAHDRRMDSALPNTIVN